MRTHHLKVITDGKGVKAKEILRKINGKESKKMWFQIGRAMKVPQGRATITVQKMTAAGAVKESTAQEETEEMLFDETEDRFQLAMNAPITSTDLITELGNLADTEIAQHIVVGTFDIPDEIDKATAEILEEIGSMGVQLTNGSICIVITPEEFREYWKRAREGTSSSISGVHFGHYKAAAQSTELSGFLAKQVTLIVQTGYPPKRWSRGLTVMLENIAVLAFVNKLRAILLMEADFNMHKKIIFGK